MRMSLMRVATGLAALLAVTATASLPACAQIVTPMAPQATGAQQARLSDAALDQLLAPIALYPDPLLGQILMASTYPLEVVQAARWVREPRNAALKDDALAAEAAWLLTRLEGLATEMRAGFDPATSAEHVLDALPSAGARSRAGVLIGAPTDRPVPLALRGSLRVPWPDPRDDHGVIGDAWQHGRAGVVVLDDGRIVVNRPSQQSGAACEGHDYPGRELMGRRHVDDPGVVR